MKPMYLTAFLIFVLCVACDKGPDLQQQSNCYSIAKTYIANLNKNLIMNDPHVVALRWTAHYNEKDKTCYAEESVSAKTTGNMLNRYIIDVLKDKLLYMMTYGADGMPMYHEQTKGPSSFPNDSEFDNKLNALFERK